MKYIYQARDPYMVLCFQKEGYIDPKEWPLITHWKICASSPHDLKLCQGITRVLSSYKLMVIIWEFGTSCAQGPKGENRSHHTGRGK